MSKQQACPNCGAMFRRGRLACPECGSDAETGWRSSEDIDYLSTDIPDYYEEPAGERSEVPGMSPRAVRIVLILALIGMLAAVGTLFFWGI